jgi:eukaryotic-like serine/threonine-protein kinase
MTSPQRARSLAQELGKYRLIAELARGGMGNVYLAVAQGPGGFHKLVALKELRPEFAGEETYVTMFLEEARLAARLTHPNIVQTNEVGSDGGRHFMVMEYLDGRSLYRVARNAGRLGGLPLGAHLRIIAEALRGLHHAHELRGFDGEPLGIVHRDVSPLNVLVTFDGQAKVLDFGVAKAVDSANETQAGILKGRLAYMAPEQARCAKVDRRADVYAAGVMIWEAAAGRRLWAGKSDVEILTTIVGEGLARAACTLPESAADLEPLCARAMALDPAARHATAEELLLDLERYLAGRDDAMSMREVGSLVSLVFESERQRMHAIIDDALAHTREAPRSGVMASHPIRPSRMEVPDISAPPHAPSAFDEMPSIPSLLVDTPSGRQSSLEPRINSASAIHLGGPAPTTVDRPPAPVSRWPVVTGVAAALACVTLLLARDISMPSRVEPSPQIRASGSAPVAPAPVASAAQETAPVAPPAIAEPRAALAIPSVVVVRSVAPPRAPVQAAPRAAKTAPAADAARSVSFSGETAGAEPTRVTVDPAGGRLPQRPIVTSNPYGAP